MKAADFALSTGSLTKRFSCNRPVASLSKGLHARWPSRKPSSNKAITACLHGALERTLEGLVIQPVAVLRRFKREFLSHRTLSSAQARAWRAIVACLTLALSGERLRCKGCHAEH